MIVCWPGVTEAGSICTQPVIIEDFFPSILDMAGVSSIEQIGGVIDGRSFVNLLRGDLDQARDDRPLVWHFPNHWGPRGPGIGPSSAIRLGDCDPAGVRLGSGPGWRIEHSSLGSPALIRSGHRWCQTSYSRCGT